MPGQNFRKENKEISAKPRDLWHLQLRLAHSSYCCALLHLRPFLLLRVPCHLTLYKNHQPSCTTCMGHTTDGTEMMCHKRDISLGKDPPLPCRCSLQMSFSSFYTTACANPPALHLQTRNLQRDLLKTLHKTGFCGSSSLAICFHKMVN